jgi:hypothetical protein
MAPSHFPLIALLTAGRGSDGAEIEASMLTEHIAAHIAGARAVGVRHSRILLTDLTDGAHEAILRRVERRLRDASDVAVVRDAERAGGREYYRDICFKIRVATANTSCPTAA